MPQIPLNKKHPFIFERIGAITMQWNRAEYYLEALVRYLLMNAPSGDFLLSTWGNDGRARVAKEIISNHETDKRFRTYCLAVLAAYNTCRENRNLVVHGHIEAISKTGFSSLRMTKNIDKRLVYKITLPILEETERDLIALCAHLRFIVNHNHVLRGLIHRPLPSLEKPPAPRNLSKILQPVLKDVPPPPQSSEG